MTLIQAEAAVAPDMAERQLALLGEPFRALGRDRDSPIVLGLERGPSRSKAPL